MKNSGLQQPASLQDLYGGPVKLPYTSINFITAHDRFTLHVRVSCNEKNGNNDICRQDSELDWSLTSERATVLGFVKRLVHLRRSHPTFRRGDFFRTD